ncbi:hypothetical protein BX666DRAFT_576303 [Dichotomocladium elegans]|nr:hypothetical protein BX666DRAFT_576303 [Dichotomocladium elegans]
MATQRQNDELTPLLLPQREQHHKAKTETFGLILMTLSALGFSTMSLFVKLSGATFPSFEIVFFRSIIQVFVGLVGCAYYKVNPLGRPNVRKWLVLRGLAGTIGLALFFFSVTQMPLADATVVFFLGPTFTAILAAVVLKESFTVIDGLCAALCMVGAVLVSKPTFVFGGGSVPEADHGDALKRVVATLAAVLGATMSAVAYVTVRKVGKGAHFMVHIVYFGVISSVLSPPALALFQGGFIMPKGWNEWSMLLMTGITASVGQCLLNLGLQLAPAGPGTLMRMNDVVFAFLFGIFILHEYPDIYSITGAVLIVSMTTALGMHKYYRAKNNSGSR